MGNKRTHEADHEKLANLIDNARGERSLRQYASDAGLNHNVLFRIRNGSYNPGLTVLQKLANADPQNGVTLEDFMHAAGFSTDFENLKGFFSTVVQKVHEDKAFQDQAWEVIKRSLVEKAIVYQVMDGHENYYLTYQPNISLKIEDQAFDELWLQFWTSSESRETIRSRSTDLAADLIRMPATVPAKAGRKIVIVVENQDVYEELVNFSGGTLIRGWLSAILVDFSSKQVLDEVTISTYTGLDDTDPMPIK